MPEQQAAAMSVCRIIAPADGTPSAFAGAYVVSYDPHEGDFGRLRLSFRLERAMRAPAAYWLDQAVAVNKSNPIRPDGKPNRPLSAYHLEIFQV